MHRRVCVSIGPWAQTQIKPTEKLFMSKVVSSSLNMHHILSSLILCCFLTLSVYTHPVISAANSKLAYEGFKGSSMSTKTIPATKDIVYKPEFNLSVRLYLPQDTVGNQKLPLLVYIHGGAFLCGSAFEPLFDNFLNIFVPEANVIAVSIDYRVFLRGRYQLPCAYNDSWDALKWVATHWNGDGPEDWLNKHADFQRVFLAGDSAGANIVHQMALKLGVEEELAGLSVAGIILYNPYFWGKDPIPGEITDVFERGVVAAGWKLVCPTCNLDHPWINPATDPNLSRVASPRLQVFLSENDSWHVRERGWYYAQELRQSGWSGHQEVIDFQGEEHDFLLNDLSTRNATILRSRMATFINQDWSDALGRREWSNIPYDIISMAKRGWK